MAKWVLKFLVVRNDHYSIDDTQILISLLHGRFWDDWIREPEQRKNRACIRPEIPRTRTFGRIGVSKYEKVF